jgi:hypothetical protein
MLVDRNVAARVGASGTCARFGKTAEQSQSGKRNDFKERPLPWRRIQEPALTFA